MDKNNIHSVVIDGNNNGSINNIYNSFNIAFNIFTKSEDEMEIIIKDELKAIILRVIKNKVLTIEDYGMFWGLLYKIESDDYLRGVFLRAIEVLFLLEIKTKYEAFRSAYMSYKERKIIKTENFKKILNGEIFFKKRAYPLRKEFINIIAEANENINMIVAVYDDMIETAAKRENILSEYGAVANEEFYKRKIDETEPIVKNLEILFTQNYQGSFYAKHPSAR